MSPPPCLLLLLKLYRTIFCSTHSLLTLPIRIETDIFLTEAKIRDDVDKHKKYRIGRGDLEHLM